MTSDNQPLKITKSDAMLEEANVQFDLEIAFVRSGDQWIGTTTPFGMVLRGSSREDILARLRRTCDFFMETVNSGRSVLESTAIISGYLDSHAIDHTIDYRYDKGAAYESFGTAEGIGTQRHRVNGRLEAVNA